MHSLASTSVRLTLTTDDASAKFGAISHETDNSVKCIYIYFLTPARRAYSFTDFDADNITVSTMEIDYRGKLR